MGDDFDMRKLIREAAPTESESEDAITARPAGKFLDLFPFFRLLKSWSSQAKSQKEWFEALFYL